MCGDESRQDPTLIDAGSRRSAAVVGGDAHPTRRVVLGGLSAVLGGALVAPLGGRAAAADTFAGTPAVLAAMHVHGSSSEQLASWEAYGPRALEAGVDVVFMTDHGYRTLAWQHWTSLQDIRFRVTVTGAAARQAGTKTGGSLRLIAESAGAAATEVQMAVEDVTSHRLWEKLRTSIAGQTLRHTFGPSSLGDGALYEVRVMLSKHPAGGGRPGGQCQLWYRFGAGLARGRRVEGGGLVGVVTAPLPVMGVTVDLELERDVAATWPQMLAADNGFYQLAFVVSSPRAGAVAEVVVAGVQFARTGHDVASVRAAQRLMADTYSQRYGVRFHPGIEMGHGLPHLNAYSDPQHIPDNEALDGGPTLAEYHRTNVQAVHAGGGLVSWNHPFGAGIGVPLIGAAAVGRRRQVFAAMAANGLYGADILEVGYPVRGSMGIEEHLGLWDTFSRRARFLTGNGVTDDHAAGDWRTMGNGFATGIWAGSRSHADLMAALRSGRAFTRHAGRWAGGQLDLLVDGVVPMGKAQVTSRTSRRMAITATNLPAGSAVDIVAGPVDGAGNDPGTTVLASIPAAAFGSSGVASRWVDTTRSCFARVNVRSAGQIVGVSNPVWLLRRPPPGGIPPARQA